MAKVHGSRTRKGTVLIYTAIGMTAFTGLVSLSVDVGHVRVVKKQLQRTADAAARAAAAGLVTSTTAARTTRSPSRTPILPMARPSS